MILQRSRNRTRVSKDGKELVALGVKLPTVNKSIVSDEIVGAT